VLKALLSGLTFSRAALRAKFAAHLAMKRAAQLSALYALMGLLALVGLGFLLAGAFLLVSLYVGPMAAAFVFAGVFLIAAIVVFAIARAAHAPRTDRAEASEAAAADAARMPDPPRSMGDEVRQTVREHAMPLTLAALAAGIATGARAVNSAHKRRARRFNGAQQPAE
jgi:hypothetical protein